MTTTLVIKMKANMADVPYVFEKRPKPTAWRFTLTYAQMPDFLPLVHQYFAASRMPSAERDESLQVGLARVLQTEFSFAASQQRRFREP